MVGLYLNPPEKAIVLCMDEKSSVQGVGSNVTLAADGARRAKSMTHDYKRNGTTTLFAALDVLAGKVIGSCMPKHRHQVLRFLSKSTGKLRKGLTYM